MLSNWTNEHLVYMALGRLESLAPGSSDVFIIFGTMLHWHLIFALKGQTQDGKIVPVCHIVTAQLNLDLS